MQSQIQIYIGDNIALLHCVEVHKHNTPWLNDYSHKYYFIRPKIP